MRTNLERYPEGSLRSGRVDKDIRNGVIEKMEYTEHHGIIRTSDERRFYFHQKNVLDNMFYSLEPGSEVRFVEDKVGQRAQATSVYVLGTQSDID